MRNEYTASDVRIVDFPATRVGSLLHRGDPRGLGGTIRRFIEWRRENRLPPEAYDEIADTDRRGWCGRVSHGHIPIDAKNTANNPSSTITRKIDLTTDVVV